MKNGNLNWSYLVWDGDCLLRQSFLKKRGKMILAQKLHSGKELEQGRIEFYRRFERIRDSLDESHLTYTPTCEFPAVDVIETEYIN